MIKYLILISVMAFSCKSSKVKQKPPRSEECQAFVKFVHNNWKKSAEGYFNFLGDDTARKAAFFYFRKNGEKCLRKYSRSDVIALFGTPSAEKKYEGEKSILEYHFNKECANNENGCLRLKILLDAKADTIMNIFAIGIENNSY